MVLEDAKFQDQDFDSNVNRSWGTEINIEGTSYATSLFWQPLQNKDDPYAEVEEASAGVLEGADLFCINRAKRRSSVFASRMKDISREHRLRRFLWPQH